MARVGVFGNSGKNHLNQKKRKYDNMASNIIVNLPDDVLELILLKLPSSSLTRCKSVSRAWNDLISDPRFVHQHYMTTKNLMAKRSQCTTTTFLVYKRPHMPNCDDYFTVVSMSHAVGAAKLNNSTLICQPYFARDPQILLSEFELVYPAGYGIYCLFEFGLKNKKVVLWNPAIRELTELRYPYLHSEPGMYSYGFAQVEYFKDSGFSYKVGLMHIAYKWKSDAFCLSIELYSSIENSWKLFQHVYYGKTKGLDGKWEHHGTNLNGKFYFLPWFYGEEVRSIVTFDMTTHEFGSVKVPSFLTDDPAYGLPDLVLTKFDEKSLCLLAYKGNIHEAKLEAWVYLEHSESWILKSSVRGVKHPMEVSVFGINVSTGILLKLGDELCYCRYGSGEIEMLQGVVESKKHEFNQIVEYEESIVSFESNYL